MNALILLLLSPAVICSGHQRYRKSANPNDEPFLPIHPEYPYNPKLMKRGIEQIQPQPQQQQQQPQHLAQLAPELYAPKVDARDSYSASYSQSPYLSSLDPYAKAAATQNALASSPYYQSSYSSPYGSSPYSSLLNSFGSPYGSGASAYGSSAAAPAYGSGAPQFASAASHYGPTSPGYGGTSPYGAAPGAYPYYYYQPPYYYPNYYGQPPYPPPPSGYPSGSSKHQNDDDDDDEDDKHREKSKKTGHHKNRLRNSDRDSSSNQYVDGTNYIISSAKDLDGESSSHRTPSHYNQIDTDSDVHTNTVPKTYRLVSISGQQPSGDYNSGQSGYIKIQQLEQLMRQALARLLAQNAAQQASLAQIQQEAQQSNKDNQQYLNVPTSIAKTGLSYVINPTILSRVNPGQYNPSQLIQTQTNNKQTYAQKPTTTVTAYQSPGIYIPPKSTSDQSSAADYDYDSAESATARSQSAGAYQATAEPARNNYPYSTYRPTQQTSLEDVNFGSKQKSKS